MTSLTFVWPIVIGAMDEFGDRLLYGILGASGLYALVSWTWMIGLPVLAGFLLYYPGKAGQVISKADEQFH